MAVEAKSTTRLDQISKSLKRFSDVVEGNQNYHHVTPKTRDMLTRGIAKTLQREDGAPLVLALLNIDETARITGETLVEKVNAHVVKLVEEKRGIVHAQEALGRAETRKYTELTGKLKSYLEELNIPISTSYSPNRERHKIDRIIKSQRDRLFANDSNNSRT